MLYFPECIHVENLQNLITGDNVFINYDTWINNSGALVTLENNTSVGMHTVFLTDTHLYGNEENRAGYICTRLPIHIESGVWIGARSTILPGVRIAKGCVIGAGSVIVKSCTEPNSLYAGNPAKWIKFL